MSLKVNYTFHDQPLITDDQAGLQVKVAIMKSIGSHKFQANVQDFSKSDPSEKYAQEILSGALISHKDFTFLYYETNIAQQVAQLSSDDYLANAKCTCDFYIKNKAMCGDKLCTCELLTKAG